MSRKDHGVTWKSLVLTVILIPLNFYWIISGEVDLTGYALNTYAVPFYNVVFTVFVLILVNMVVRKTTSFSLFSDNEVLTTYILLSAACALSSITFMTILVNAVGHASWYATSENEWRELFLGKLPGWLFVKDREVLRGYYEGDSSFYTIPNIKAWARPVFYWSLFTTCLVFVMLCINVVLRKQWVERERLAYPIAELAIQITHNTKGIFRSRMVWLGFSISASIAIINGLSFLYPAIPTIPVKRVGSWHGFGQLFTQRPWSAIGIISMSFYPFVIGLGFLMPLDLAFSSWFFFLFYKAELVLTNALGINVPGLPYHDQQSFGAALGIVLVILVYNRRYLVNVIKTAIKGRSAEDRDEPISYRSAILGIALGAVFLMAFSVKIGMSLWLAPLFFGFYFVIMLVITRMRAELGFPVHAMINIPAHRMLVSLIGTRALGKDNLIGMSIYSWFDFRFTSNPMPHQMEGFKLADRANINTKRLFYSFIFVTALGSVLVFWTMLHLLYNAGTTTGTWSENFGWDIFERLGKWLYYPNEPNHYAAAAVVFGVLFSTGMMFLRARLLWWPFHPIGFVISGDWGMMYLWSCMLVSSVIKWNLLKFGGRKASQKLVKVAVGLILGDFLVGSLWSLISLIMRRPMYTFWP